MSDWVLRVGCGESDERLQLCEGCTGVYGIRRQGHSIPQMIGASGCDQCGCGVEHHHVAAGGFLPGQDFSNQRGIVRGVSAGDIFQSCSL